MTLDRFHGDRPILTSEEDRLGFSPLAARIAEALTEQAAGKGFVLGVEGKWGSGKSSLLALVVAQLRAMNLQKVAAVEFRPWLIGDRDQLLAALFEDLAKAITSLKSAGGDATAASASAIAHAAEKVRAFAAQLGPVGKLAGVAGLFVPGATLAGGIIEKVAEAAAQKTGGPTLAARKDQLAELLLALDCRIVVTIDDVDRLEPSEVAELLRLVRSVADFPNVSYLLCYDAAALGHAIEEATGVASGAAYLEKIVQTEVAVPRPETFALRRWFSSELQRFASCPDHRLSELQHVISETGGRTFQTARAVARVLDSLRLYWPSLHDRVDLADLVWLRMIAVSAPTTYRWIEEYLAEHVALNSGRAHLSNGQREEMAERLDEALTLDNLPWNIHYFELAQHLPGIGRGLFDQEKEKRIFAGLGHRNYEFTARDKRLASPNHSRIYFSLIEPPDAITDGDYIALRDAARTGIAACTALLVGFAAVIGDAGATKLDRLLDQLGTADKEWLKGWPLQTLAIAIAAAADDTAAKGGADEWGYPATSYATKSFLERVRSAIEPDSWAVLARTLFETLAPTYFLTYILRDEIFAHGFYGDRPNPNERLFSPELFDELRVDMLARYAKIGVDAIMVAPTGTHMLYAWSQGGGLDTLRGIAAERAVDDGWLLAFLSKLHGPTSSLSLDAIRNFFDDPVAIVRRLQKLANAPVPVMAAREEIASLKASIHFDGDDFGAIVDQWEAREKEQGVAAMVAGASSTGDVFKEEGGAKSQTAAPKDSSRIDEQAVSQGITYTSAGNDGCGTATR